MSSSSSSSIMKLPPLFNNYLLNGLAWGTIGYVGYGFVAPILPSQVAPYSMYIQYGLTGGMAYYGYQGGNPAYQNAYIM